MRTRPRPSPTVPRSLFRATRLVRSGKSVSIPPPPDSISTTTLAAAGKPRVTRPEPALMFKTVGELRIVSCTPPLPVSTRTSVAVIASRRTEPDPASTRNSRQSARPPVTLPEPGMVFNELHRYYQRLSSPIVPYSPALIVYEKRSPFVGRRDCCWTRRNGQRDVLPTRDAWLFGDRSG